MKARYGFWRERDARIIDTAKRLLADGHISADEMRRLKVDGDGGIIDDTTFPVDLADNGTVYIHGRGAYPVELKAYTAPLAV